VIAAITERILQLHGFAALALIFAIPALESSAFVGFLFPGEIAVLLGGVLAFQGRVTLPEAIGAAVLGAIVGDTIGYLVGRRFGRSLLRGTLGKLPMIRTHLEHNLDRAQDYVQRKGGRAVFFGRFTAALRVLVPGLAGMSEMHYPTFLFYNALGGALWGAGFVLLGYAAGDGWRHVEHVAGKLGFALLALVVLGLLAARLLRNNERLHAFGDRLAATPPMAWFRRHLPGPVTWSRHRLDPRSPSGFPLTITVAVGAMSAWAFGALTQDILAHEESIRLDPQVERWVLAHRTGGATLVMKTATWLGSNAIAVPVILLVGGWFLWRRRDWRPGAKLAAVLAVTVVAYDIVKPWVARPRPPVSDRIGGSTFSGWSFPSGHAAQAMAVWGLLALLVVAGRPLLQRVAGVLFAVLVVAAVGASRVYLGAHWFTDVLGGFALGGLVLSVELFVLLTFERTGGVSLSRPESRAEARRR
jgi:undecaprenyl-diphosphatase